MKFAFTLLAALALAVGISTSAQAQTSNILVISQDASTKVVTVIKAADDPTITGAWLSFSSQLSTTGTAIENKLFSGLAYGKVIVVRIDASKTMTVLLADASVLPADLHGSFVAVDTNLPNVVGAIKNSLYLGL